MRIKGYKIFYRSEDPPDWNRLCDILQEANTNGKFDGEFVLLEVPRSEGETIFEVGPGEDV